MRLSEHLEASGYDLAGARDLALSLRLDVHEKSYGAAWARSLGLQAGARLSATGCLWAKTSWPVISILLLIHHRR